MPDLLASLQTHDLGHLHIIAGFWGLELESRDAASAVEELCASILDLDSVRETVEILPPDSRAALTALIESNGRVEWAIFSRKYGDVREIGTARRDRERPHLKPISAAEVLYYRGLLAKAFFDSEKGAQEFAYIPEDLFEIIQYDQQENSPTEKQEPLGRLATPIEKAHESPSNDFILDDATTYLAALRVGNPPSLNPDLQANLQALLIAAQILNAKNEPQAEAVKKFLEAPRADALNMLYGAWVKSQTFNELRLIPAIICEGEWSNQPQVTREFLMNLLGVIPREKWWSLPAFLRDLKLKFPDFQRPAGDYDSWFIKRASDGQYLRGFAYWDQVDGALVKYVIHMLHRLGKVDLASPEDGKEFTAFRLRGTEYKAQGEGKFAVSSSGKISVSRNFSRAVRYQVARFCEWDEEKNHEYAYHVTAKSLKRANQHGLKAEQLLALLVKYTNSAVPPTLVKALKTWDADGIQARVETHTVLRVAKPEIIEEMRKSKAGKFLGESLSPAAVIIKSGAEAKVIEALTELGLFTDFEIK